MNWNNPEERAALIERVGPVEYERLHSEHRKASVVATINGHAIRPVGSRFGILFQVGGTGRAFVTQELAEAFARQTYNPTITVDGGEPISFAEFLAVNDFDDAEEIEKIAEALKKDGRHLYGGGAADEFTIKVVPAKSEPMTFAEFKATKREVGDLGEQLQDEGYNGQPGLLYLDALFITPKWFGWNGAPPEMLKYDYHLLIGNQEWLSNSLEELERRLYAFAVSEDYITDPDAKPETQTDPLVDCPNTSNLLTRAIYTADIDAACVLVQDALGITDGGLAGQVLPGPEEWQAATPETRQTWLGEWLHAEVIRAI